MYIYATHIIKITQIHFVLVYYGIFLEICVKKKKYFCFASFFLCIYRIFYNYYINDVLLLFIINFFLINFLFF